MDFVRNNVKLMAILAIILLIFGVVIVVTSSLGGGDRTQSVHPQSGDLLSFTGSGGQRPTASIDPCTLIDANVLEQSLGLSLEKPESGYVGNPLGERYCVYYDARDTDEVRFYLSIVFESSIDPVLLDAGFTVRQMFKGREVSPSLIEAVDDVGTEAFWGGTGAEVWNGLHVLVDDVYLQVDVYSGDEDLDYRVARNMTVTALEKLFGQ